MITLDIVSIGCMAGELQVPVSQLREIATALGIDPVARINNVPHFTASSVERIAEHLRADTLTITRPKEQP